MSKKYSEVAYDDSSVIDTNSLQIIIDKLRAVQAGISAVYLSLSNEEFKNAWDTVCSAKKESSELLLNIEECSLRFNPTSLVPIYIEATATDSTIHTVMTHLRVLRLQRTPVSE